MNDDRAVIERVPLRIEIAPRRIYTEFFSKFIFDVTAERTHGSRTRRRRYNEVVGNYGLAPKLYNVYVSAFMKIEFFSRRDRNVARFL